LPIFGGWKECFIEVATLERTAMRRSSLLKSPLADGSSSLLSTLGAVQWRWKTETYRKLVEGRRECISLGPSFTPGWKAGSRAKTKAGPHTKTADCCSSFSSEQRERSYWQRFKVFPHLFCQIASACLPSSKALIIPLVFKATSGSCPSRHLSPEGGSCYWAIIHFFLPITSRFSPCCLWTFALGIN